MGWLRNRLVRWLLPEIRAQLGRVVKGASVYDPRRKFQWGPTGTFNPDFGGGRDGE